MAELIAGLIGIAIGAIGTLIGAGGGFLLAPLLLLVEPRWSTEVVTGYSIAVVAANASTGAFSYYRMRRIDIRSFPLFALAATPGAVVGALLTATLPREVFDIVFGLVLAVIGGWLALRRAGNPGKAARQHATVRDFTDAAGIRHVWSFDLRLGVACSAAVGFLSSLLGIGGGIVHVPILATVLAFPPHVATATSHAVLAVTAIVATVIHVVHGDYGSDTPLVLATCAGAIAGAPIGARFSSRVPGAIILRVLGASLAAVGARLLIQAL
jgi:uncharacterized membrane protein YfcA